MSTELLKFLDDNTDPKTVAALQTLGKRYKNCLCVTLAIAKKIHEVYEKYGAMCDLEFTCPLIEAASLGSTADVESISIQMLPKTTTARASNASSTSLMI